MPKANAPIEGTPTQDNDPGLFKIIGIALLAFIGPQILAGIFLVIYAAVRNIEPSDLISNDNIFLNFILTAIISAIGAWVIYAYSRSTKTIGRLGFHKTATHDLAKAIPGYLIYFVAIIIANIIITLLLPELNLDQLQETGFNNASGIALTFAFISLVVIAPFFEELIFRGFLFQRIAKVTGFLPAAILISALFGLAHGQLNVAVDTFILGMVASWLVWNTKSIWPAIMLHATKNLIAFIFLFVIQVNI